MIRRAMSLSLASLAFCFGAAEIARGAAPVFAARPAVEDLVTDIPCGKTLVIPLAADDAEGDPLAYSVVSSNKNLYARVLTGNPVLKIEVEYAGTPEYPAFTGEMRFLLLREFAPVTTGFIGGFAQAAFYDNVIFHRLIPGFVVQGGDKAGNGTGQINGVTQPPRFDFRNELNPWLLFTGRGQLAMANRGYDRGTQRTTTTGGVQVPTSEILIGDFAATNGSQFFITFDSPRHLDFKHTIFGQMVRGFDVLDLIEGIPTNAGDVPTATLKIVTARLERNTGDALLLAGTKGVGPAELTVTADDGTGAAGGKTQKIIPLAMVEDTTNTPPMIRPLPAFTPKVGEPFELASDAVDLEGDALEFAYLLTRNNAASISRFFEVTRLNGLGTPGSLDLPVGVGELKDPRLQPTLVRNFDGTTFLSVATTAPSVGNPFAPFDPYGVIEVAEIGVGDKKLIASPVTLDLTASSSSGTVAVATFRSASNAASPNDFTATVNWGDGTDVQVSTGTNAPVTIARSLSVPGLFEVRGTHVYTRGGSYAVAVEIAGSLGAVASVRSRAEVAVFGSTLKSQGLSLALPRAVVSGRALAFFTDTLPGTRPRDYEAEIDWGDGERSRGFVRKYANGRFGVVGIHRYANPGTHPVTVTVQRKTPEAETVAWSEVTLSRFNPLHPLPPYPNANITARWSELPVKAYAANGSVTASGTLVVANGGSKASPPPRIRFYLSPDPVLDTTGATPDVRLTLGGGSAVVSEISLEPLGPGESGDVPVRNSGDSDRTLRMPKNRTGAGEYIVGEVVYADPLTDLMPVAKTFAFGPLQGFVVTPLSISVAEGTPPTSTTFKVRLDTAPTADVTVDLDVVGTNGVVDITEASVSPAELVFTPANGTADLTVTVTGADDALDDGTITNIIRLKAAESDDARFDGMDPPDVTVRVQDND